MILESARKAIANLLDPAIRRTVLKVIGVTILVLASLWFGLQIGFDRWVWPHVQSALGTLPDWLSWVAFPVSVASSLGLFVLVVMLMAPVTALVAGLFLDDVAEAVERTDYPAETPGRPLPLSRSLIQALSFALVVAGANLVGLLFIFIPGVNILAFFLINGYLIGREYFEFAAMRLMPEDQARALRKRHSGTVMMGGALSALLLAIPFANLLTPVFSAAVMVHLVKRLKIAA